MAKPELTKELLEELLDYDPSTGVLTWKERACKWFSAPLYCKIWNAQHAGREAGSCFENNGVLYGRIKIFRVTYPIAVIVWALSRGVWPDFKVAHVNGDPFDNRPGNLSHG